MTAETPWQYKPEFSTDKMVDDNEVLTVRCRWNGTLSVSAERQKSDDCVGNPCGSRGVRRNKATFRCLEDYTCVTAVSS